MRICLQQGDFSTLRDPVDDPLTAKLGPPLTSLAVVRNKR